MTARAPTCSDYSKACSILHSAACVSSGTEYRRERQPFGVLSFDQSPSVVLQSHSRQHIVHLNDAVNRTPLPTQHFLTGWLRFAAPQLELIELRQNLMSLVTADEEPTFAPEPNDAPAPGSYSPAALRVTTSAANRAGARGATQGRHRRLLPGDLCNCMLCNCMHRGRRRLASDVVQLQLLWQSQCKACKLLRLLMALVRLDGTGYRHGGRFPAC